MSACTLCPRMCKADREKEPGFCGAGARVKLARAALHMWEEPCISGSRGSGTVFFSGCPLKCCFCQNYRISRDGVGKEISTERLAQIFCELQSKGAHNINLVTPTQYIFQILEALEKAKAEIPVLYNSSGYERVETLRMLGGKIDIYLPDLKYHSSELSARYSAAPDYFETASKALDEMYEQVGNPVFNADGLLIRGMMVRHLVMPGARKDSMAVVAHIAKRYGKNVLLSLMSQYTPVALETRFGELNRKVTSFEYDSVLEYAAGLGLEGFSQQRGSATSDYTPPFDLEGV